MPRNDWQKATIKDKIAGRTYERQSKLEKASDDAVDAWIARQEETLKQQRKGRKKRTPRCSQ